MSVLNAWIHPHEAIVATDTDGIAADGSRRPVSKAMIIAHLPAVLANRGQSAFLHFTFARAVAAQTFDELLDTLTPAALLDIDRHLLAENFYAEVGDFVGNEMLVAGWSAQRGRMLGRVFVRRGVMPEFEVADTDFAISPWDDSMPDIPRTRANLEKIARAQVRWLRQLGVAGGGSLLVTRVTQRSVETRHVLTFQPHREAA